MTHLILGSVHTGSQVPSHLRSIHAILAMEVGLTTSHGIPKYDMDAYMATLFGSEVQGKKARPNSQHKPHEDFCIN